MRRHGGSVLTAATALAVAQQRRFGGIRREVRAMEPPAAALADEECLIWWRRLQCDRLIFEQSRTSDDWLAYVDGRAQFVQRYGYECLDASS